MNVTLNVNQKKIFLDSFIIPEMNLSSARSTMIKEKFELFIKVSELIQHMQEDYAKWIIESKEDDEQCGSPQDELAKAGYPPIDQLIHIPELGKLVFSYYLIRELFDKFLPPIEDKNIKHWLDEISYFNVEGDYVKFAGICYRKPISNEL